MAKYFDDITACEQHNGLVNLLSDDSEPIPTISKLGTSVDEPATFCVRCRSLSNASNIYSTAGDTGTREWINSLEDDVKCDMVGNGFHPTPCGDGADLPLLSTTDEGGTDQSSNWREMEVVHCHSAIPGTSAHNVAVRNQLLAATLLCLIFMVAEAVGGYLAGSLAVQTDAAHLLSDLASFGGSLLALWLSRRPPSRRLTFGWARAEPLAALASVILLWTVTVGVAAMAVLRLLVGGYDIDADTMMIVAGLGVVINIVMGLVLHSGCNGFRNAHHGHSHSLPVRASSSPSDDVTELPPSHNINMRAAIVHVVGDLVQSIGVFIAAVFIKFCPAARWVDPVCTLVCCTLVLGTSCAVARDALLILLEACPSSTGLQPATLTMRLRSIEGVRAVHDLHVWNITPGRAALTAHLTVGSAADSETVLRNAQRMLKSVPELEHTTLQISAGSSHDEMESLLYN